MADDAARGCLYEDGEPVEELTDDEIRALEQAAHPELAEARSHGRFRVVTTIRSQNFNLTPGRRMSEPFGIVLHHTGGGKAGDIPKLTKPNANPEKSVSANDYITKDGTIYELCEFPKRAWHAGECFEVEGITDWNTHGWGIEIENLGTAGDAWPKDQIEAVVWRARQQRQKLGVRSSRLIVRHRDIAKPRGRKPDTSDSFPYAEVRRRIFAATDPTDEGQVHGHAWPGRKLAVATPPLHGDDVLRWQKRMRERGFTIPADGKYEQPDGHACLQFQRRAGIPESGVVGQRTWDATFAPIEHERITPRTSLVAPPRTAVANAQKFVLDREHGYGDAKVREIVQLYFNTAIPGGLDPLLVIAQMVEETATLTSFWSQPPRRNPAGIGVTGEQNVGISFATWRDAVRAHVGRLLAYAVEPDRETPAQRMLIAEALAVRPLASSVRGKAPTLAGLAERWAADPAYADKLSSVANAIRAS
jgi:N-acetyl-anhydromuramyl-L-alanine amidase AmpD